MSPGKAAAFLGGMDTIVVSAGAGGVTPILSTEPEEFQRIIDNNLRPFFLAVRYGAEHLLAAGKGSIIAVSSTFGLVGRSERVAYCGAKAGMNGMVKAMALDLANKDIRVTQFARVLSRRSLHGKWLDRILTPRASFGRKAVCTPFRAPARSRKWANWPFIWLRTFPPSSQAKLLVLTVDIALLDPKRCFA